MLNTGIANIINFENLDMIHLAPNAKLTGTVPEGLVFATMSEVNAHKRSGGYSVPVELFVMLKLVTEPINFVEKFFTNNFTLLCT
jgi:hypothetical protein